MLRNRLVLWRAGFFSTALLHHVRRSHGTKSAEIIESGIDVFKDCGYSLACPRGGPGDRKERLEWRGGRVAECTGLLNRRTVYSRTAGSNPALSVGASSRPVLTHIEQAFLLRFH